MEAAAQILGDIGSLVNQGRADYGSEAEIKRKELAGSGRVKEGLRCGSMACGISSWWMKTCMPQGATDSLEQTLSGALRLRIRKSSHDSRSSIDSHPADPRCSSSPSTTLLISHPAYVLVCQSSFHRDSSSPPNLRVSLPLHPCMTTPQCRILIPFSHPIRSSAMLNLDLHIELGNCQASSWLTSRGMQSKVTRNGNTENQGHQL